MKKPMIFEGILIILLIFLVFIMYCMLTNDDPSKMNGWEINGIAPVSYIHPGVNKTLYAFMGYTGNSIYSIDDNGNINWKNTISDKWCVYNTFYRPSTMYLNYMGDYTMHGKKVVCCSENGILYLYIRENKTTYLNHDYLSNEYTPLKYNCSELGERIVAISSHGKILWNVSISEKYNPFDNVNIEAKNGRIYVFNDYNETILNNKGDILFKICNISDPASIDENGNIYVVMNKDPEILPVLNGSLYNYKEPSNIINAYDSNGILIWQTKISTLIYREESLHSLPLQTNLPLYQNNTLYLPVKDGVVALDRDGSIKWSKNFSEGYFRLFDLLPIDSQDNVYIRYYDFDPNLNDSYIMALASDGSIISETIINSDDYYQGRACANNGTLYSIKSMSAGDALNIEDLPIYCVTAYDMINGASLWEYYIHPDGQFITTINKSNIHEFMSPMPADFILNTMVDPHNRNYTYYPQSDGYSYILHNNNVTYFGYYITRFEWPALLDKTNCTYSGGIYAFDNNGNLLWKKPAAYFVTSMIGDDKILYYGSNNGMLYKEQIDQTIGGIAAAATIYILFRFFLIGIFSRAKDRLDNNENRNTILRYITTHPGLTLYELARNLDMNVGTARYHLFILSVNHRILSFIATGKYSRYFINSSQYSKEEQYIISLMRRDTARELSNLLLKKPGLSNIELSKELDMQKSTISACVNELLDRGIVIKSPSLHGKVTYLINQDYKDYIVSAIELIKSEPK
ncbi:conserved hypothetical protein [Methanocella paludicola SANAE]|uniref:HTH arsR-type domain-containing protein n=1 Tax=Methanocella paludicola (strain DSM 17711 / JCM 13418 / NBRC 101707 / SANAE) TaxID=304371 RepID=D1YXP8_METPS|nr:winged helix-turn-helix transcriptional regulator [Methanocella paludicola]BAI61220.1 conserved hypothetical protein [Methanocella paludicola SANAE]